MLSSQNNIRPITLPKANTISLTISMDIITENNEKVGGGSKQRHFWTHFLHKVYIYILINDLERFYTLFYWTHYWIILTCTGHIAEVIFCVCPSTGHKFNSRKSAYTHRHYWFLCVLGKNSHATCVQMLGHIISLYSPRHIRGLIRKYRLCPLCPLF